jgi:retron-type reverse transcriptase
MLRTWIPKTKKPGEFRLITQPNKRDRLVLDGMTGILIESLEPSCLVDGSQARQTASES